MRVDHGQDPQFLSHGELVVNEVQSPDIVRSGGFFAILAKLGFHAPFRVLVPQLKTQLIVNTTCLLDIGGPTFPPQQNMNAPVAIPHTRLADFLDPHLDSSLIRPPGLLVVAGRVKTDGPTSPLYRHAPVDAHPSNEFVQTARLQNFRWITSCNISRSRVGSATVFFSRVLSSSSAFSRRLSSDSRPPYFFFRELRCFHAFPLLSQPGKFS
jgi:hypothetical protein